MCDNLAPPCAPRNLGGRRSSILPHVLDALLERLLTKPDLYLDEMTDFVLDEFELSVSVDSIRRSLRACNWSKKKNQRVARERDSDLRDACLHEMSEYKSFQLIFVDESGCDTQAGIRRTGWAPRGVAPVQTARYHRDQRHQIWPAYSQDGIIHVKISKVRQTATSLKVSLESYCRGVGDGPSQIPFL